MQSNAKQSSAKQCKAKQCKAKQCKATQCNAKQYKAKQCKEIQSKAMQNKAKQCKQSNTKQSKGKQRKSPNSLLINTINYVIGVASGSFCFLLNSMNSTGTLCGSPKDPVQAAQGPASAGRCDLYEGCSRRSKKYGTLYKSLMLKKHISLTLPSQLLGSPSTPLIIIY